MKTIHHCVIALVLLFTTMNSQPSSNIDRTKRPTSKPTPRASLPDIQKATLANGLSVWLVEHHEMPTVTMHLVINAGSDHDPLDLSGLASLTADVLDEGTTGRDALQLADELESIGASLNVSSNIDGSFVTLGVLAKHLARGLAVFSDVISHPTFPQKEFERLRKQRVTSLLQQRDMPDVIASNVFSIVLYGPQHPYGNNLTGTEGSLGKMTREDLSKFYEANYRPNNATLLVVGDVKLESIVPLLNASLTDWKEGAIQSLRLPEPNPIASREVFLVDKPGAPQSQVRIGYPALSRSTPDYFPVLLMNRMLGGQFTSRINLNLRERHGYTYGARSGFSFNKSVGPFSASAGIVTDKTDSALHEFLKEIDLMKEEGLTADELSFVKKGVAGNFALTFETPGQIAGILQTIILYGLPEDYYNHYLQRIDAVTLADIRRVASKYLDSSRMAVVVVGDLATIEKPIRAANFGPVALVDVNGKVLP